MNKILIVDTYYEKMFSHIISNKSLYNIQTNEDIISTFNKGYFGNGGSYTHFLTENKFATKLLVANYKNSLTWFSDLMWRSAKYQTRIPLIKNNLSNFSSVHKNIMNTILDYQPDIVLTHDINLFPDTFALQIKSLGIKLIGEISSPLPPINFFKHFDLVISSLPSIVTELRKFHVNSHFLPLGFDARVNSSLEATSKQIAISFIGSFSKYHTKTIPLLKSISRVTSDFKIFGPVKDKVLTENGLDSFYAGEAWGLDMFQILQKSKVVINRHIDMAGDYAANMRMFEVTGVGSLLLTDFKSNLNYYFDINTDLLSYKTPDEAAIKATKILNDEKSLNQISQSGQQATLNRHTYQIRAEELSCLIQSLY